MLGYYDPDDVGERSLCVAVGEMTDGVLAIERIALSPIPETWTLEQTSGWKPDLSPS